MFAKTNFKTILLNKKMRGKKNNTLSQHDELKPNLKKILHTNGIWGLEAIVM